MSVFGRLGHRRTHIVFSFCRYWMGVEGWGGVGWSCCIWRADGAPSLPASGSLSLHIPLSLSLNRWAQENTGTHLICCSTCTTADTQKQTHILYTYSLYRLICFGRIQQLKGFLNFFRAVNKELYNISKKMRMDNYTSVQNCLVWKQIEGTVYVSLIHTLHYQTPVKSRFVWNIYVASCTTDFVKLSNSLHIPHDQW